MNLSKAVLTAEMSQKVYDNYTGIEAWMRDNGYDNWAWFDTDGTQAFTCRKHKSTEIFIVFRGTEPDQAKDILADAKAWRKPAREKGLVHFGFAQALDKVYDNIVHWIDEQKLDDATITCTGHSLGAALATIMASRLDANELYTFGSPRVGDRHFVKEMSTDKIKHYRFVNNNDIVTRVPPPLLYRHHGELVYINHYGNVRKMTTWQRIKDQWRGRLAAWKKREFFNGARDHSMDLYHRKIYHVYLQS